MDNPAPSHCRSLSKAKFPLARRASVLMFWSCWREPATSHHLPAMNTTKIDARMLATFYRDGAAVIPWGSELASLRAWIGREFAAIPCKVEFWQGDISLAECKEHFSKSGILNISTAYNIHPFLSKEDNAKFRAIHDWHHIETGADDTLAGEFATFNHAIRMAPKCIHWILFSEIVLQAAAAVYFGNFQAQKLVKVGGF